MKQFHTRFDPDLRVLPLSGSTVVGVAVFLRTERAAAKRMMLDWLQIDVGQHVRDGDRARYHNGPRPRVSGR